ncbi:MAG: Cys-tRNA(Pro) deacylase [Clostridia bacterium]|nr:Cys-tRNA(Pro) deacylase [Clostridia bacterium]
MVKTNAVRLLTAAGITLETFEYEVDESDLSGTHIADVLGVEADNVFKTLVARGDKTGIMVFCIPVELELDLKKCAQVSGNKNVEMIHVKELLGLTGYIRGGCSPVGMKKAYPTWIDETALLYDRFYVSAGKRGAQMYLDPRELAGYIHAEFADVTG